MNRTASGSWARLACGGLLVAEVVGVAMMWVLIPLAWMWVGGRAYDATGSLALYGAVALSGFVATLWPAMGALLPFMPSQ